MAAIATNRGLIDVTDVGGETGTPIIFLHGVGSDKSVWTPQLDHFSRQRRAVALSYPGYGDSTFVPGATREDYAAAVVGVMDAIAIDRAHICGLSLGGVVALRRAVHHKIMGSCHRHHFTAGGRKLTRVHSQTISHKTIMGWLLTNAPPREPWALI